MKITGKIVLSLYLILMTTAAFSQSVQGRLLDANDNPMQAIRVYLQGTVMGVETDALGNFKFEAVPPGDYHLVITAHGFKDFEKQFTLNANQNLNLANIHLQFESGISGVVTDDAGRPLSAANVYLRGTVLGSTTNDQGMFSIRRIPDGKYTLVISVMGYKQEEKNITVSRGETDNLGTFELKPMALQSSPVIVTANKYEQKLENVPASISILPARMIAERNSITLQDALRYIPGIVMNQEQINIRGSSGYSRGVGSRVMLLLDGIPYLTGDTGEINYESIPVSEIARVEVVKGSGSALYGSSAIGGVINVITRDLPSTPQLNVRMYSGFFDDPQYDQWQWSKQLRLVHGISANYARKNETAGFSINASRDGNTGYLRNLWERRYKFGGKFQLDISPYRKWTVSANIMDQRRGNFLWWKSLNEALEPPDDQLDENIHSTRYYLNSAYRVAVDSSQFYKIQGIWFHNRFKDNIGEEGNKSESDYLNLEGQYNLKTGIHFLTAGTALSYNGVTSNIFSSRSGSNVGVYFQDEMVWSDWFRTTLGMRFDYFDIDKLGTGQQVNPKAGIVFKPFDGTALRASFGSGFRAPSMAEAFTATTASGLIVIPNLDLKAERSYSAEIGWNQSIAERIGADIAFFYNRYTDLIEASFLPSGEAQFRNITKAQIQGAELSVNAGNIGRFLDAQLGYTFTDSRDLDLERVLNYRPRHTFFGNFKVRYRHSFIGVDYRFISRYERIDENFSLVIPDTEKRVAAHVVDLRLQTQISKTTLSLQVNNMLQYNYVDVVGMIAPIRQYVLTLETTIR